MPRPRAWSFSSGAPLARVYARPTLNEIVYVLEVDKLR